MEKPDTRIKGTDGIAFRGFGDIITGDSGGGWICRGVDRTGGWPRP